MSCHSHETVAITWHQRNLAEGGLKRVKASRQIRQTGPKKRKRRLVWMLLCKHIFRLHCQFIMLVPTDTLTHIPQNQIWAQQTTCGTRRQLSPYHLLFLLFLCLLLLRCHTCHSPWLDTVYIYTLNPHHHHHHHLTFLQLVIAHHDACNVTLVSRRASRDALPASSLRETKGSTVSSEWERMKQKGTERGVSGYNLIDPSTTTTTTQNLLEFEWWNHSPAACKREITLPVCDRRW